MVIEFFVEAAVHCEVDHFTGIVVKVNELFAMAAHWKDAVFVLVGEYGT